MISAKLTEKELVVELLARLIDRADQESLSERGPIAQKRGELCQSYPPTTRERLTGISNKANSFDLRREKAFVYGPTVRDAGWPLLPVLSVNADFASAGGSWISIYVMSWIFDGKKWMVLPLRFERPSREHMTGAHGYNHAQFFWSLLDDGKPLINGGDIAWLPTKQPAIPLPQDGNSPAILASAIVSLYGMIGAQSFISALQGSSFPFMSGFNSTVLNPKGRERPKRKS